MTHDIKTEDAILDAFNDDLDGVNGEISLYIYDEASQTWNKDTSYVYGNVLEIEVVNLWANRVIGDWKLPKEKRFTRTHDVFRFDMLRESTPLTNSGLLGPVRIFKSQ